MRFMSSSCNTLICFVRLLRLVIQAGAVDAEHTLSPEGEPSVSLFEHIPAGGGRELKLVESSPEENRAPASAVRWV